MRRAAILLSVAAASCAVISAKRDLDDLKQKGQTARAVVDKIEDLTRDLTPENEYWVGRSVATNILAKHHYEYLDAAALRDERLEGITAYVSQVGTLVALAATDQPRDGDRPAPIGGWHFVVVESDVINAFAAPGGFVFVTTAAVRAAKSEDELAAILAHEVAHVARGHALGTIKKSRYADISKEALTASGALSDEQLGELTVLLEGSIDDMIDAFFVKGYSRDTELEADAVALAVMERAGYDGNAFVAYLETLAAQQDTGSGGFYATHPTARDRIDRLAKKVKKGAPPPKVRTKRFVAATAELR